MIKNLQNIYWTNKKLSNILKVLKFSSLRILTGKLFYSFGVAAKLEGTVTKCRMSNKSNWSL